MKKKELNTFLHGRWIKKLLLTTKLTVILFMASFVPVSANNDSQAAKSDPGLEDMQVFEVLKETEVAVSSNDEQEELLEDVAQQKGVTGKITDNQGLPLPGVTVVVKGTTNGTVTNPEGEFSLSDISVENTLVFSFVGMLTQEIVVGSQTQIDVTMQVDAIGIEEVVAIGYGTKTIKTTTGAVAQISGEMLESRPITNTVAGLQGLIPGLTINRSSGQPGKENFSLQVRGISSLSGGGNAPLVLIDGVEGDINNLNPSDIKSTTVLKDASAAIYGARAAGGVVLITTKTGQKNQELKVNYNGGYSLNKPSNFIDLVNMQQFADMDIAANEAVGNTSDWADPVRYQKILDGITEPEARWGENDPNRLWFYMPDWNKALYEDYGSQQNHSLSITGGGERSDYAVSVGYTTVDGILKDAYDSSDRINIRLNYGFEITKKLRLETKMSYENKETVQPVWGSETIVHHVVDRFHWLPIYNKNGDYLTQWGFQNPRQLADKDAGKHTEQLHNLTSNVTLIYDIIDGLKANAQFGYNKGFINTDSYANKLPQLAWEGQNVGWSRRTNYAAVDRNQADYKNFTGYLDYRKQFSDKHMLSIMIGGSHEKTKKDFVSAWREDYTQTEIWTLNMGDSDKQFNDQSAYHWAISSMFARMAYSFNSKYNVEFNYRRDGSSIFHEDVRWGNFGGGALSWRASEETFIKNLGLFDNLKVRLSRGTSGNQDFNEDNQNFYDYIALINIGGQYPFGNTERAPGAWERGMVTNTRTWENVTTTNVGIDFAILNARLFGSFDVYKKKNKDMLLGVNLPSVLGGSPPALNIGSLETKGFELSLGWKENKGDFSYSILATLDDNSNELTNLDGIDLAAYGQRNRQGYAAGTYFGLPFDGMIQNQEELDAYKQLEGVPGDIGIGDVRFKDLNGDGKISAVDADGKDADIVDLGTNASRYNYTLNLSAKYKNFDFSAFLQGVGKRTVFHSGDFRFPWVWPWRTPLQRFYGNTWTPENPDAQYPRLTHGDIRYWNYQPSELNKIDASYLRLKNITVGYTIPKHLTDKVGVDNLRVYFSGEDLLTFDHVDGGYDAENTKGGANAYPFMKKYAFGLSLTF
uniref:SusC/RagA family TonB-linked outer membrane protein n=1 Tax=uncultured Draconibacterium sp. TaxID=1573823 RepID=UPI003216C7B7